MATIAGKDRLVGADATLYKGTIPAAATTSGTMVEGAIYKIATISGTTVFAEGFEVGDYFLGDATKSLSAANSAYLVATAEAADVTEFSMEFSADEIEVTTLPDDVKKYRRGKTDLSGSVSGINFVSEMKKAGSIANRFLRTVTVTSGFGNATMNLVDGDQLVGVFYLQKDTTTPAETTAILVAEIELFGYNLGAAVADAQTWESGMRVIGPDPILFFRSNS